MKRVSDAQAVLVAARLFRAGLVLRRRSPGAVISSIASEDVADWCRYLGTARLARTQKV